MGQIINSLDNKWTFEYFTNWKDVIIKKMSILLTVEKFSDGHNSQFPYKITHGYLVDNPYSILNNPPPFILDDKEEIFIVKKDYNDNVENNLIKDLKELRQDYKIRIFGLKSEL